MFSTYYTQSQGINYVPWAAKVRRLAIANPELPNPLEGAAIVLIDEIELHIHPQWQRTIISKLEQTFPNSQFIISSHSPQIISEVKQPGRNVYFLRVTDDGIVANLVTSAYGKDTNFILEGLMETSERPADVKEELIQLFRLIDDNQLNQARNLLQHYKNRQNQNLLRLKYLFIVIVIVKIKIFCSPPLN